jgi:thioredoxin-like negative regulator of GroEL
MQRRIPTTREMDEFFGPAEEEQLRQFTEKYVPPIYLLVSFE